MKKIFAFILLFALSNIAHPAGSNSTTFIVDFSGVINAITNLPNSIVQSFFTYTVSGLNASSQQLVDSSFKFMFSSPNPTWFCSPYNGIMAILETLYSLMLMGVALFFMLRSNDAEGRAAAKSWLQNMLIMIVLLSFSFQIFQMLLDFNTSLAASFASASMKSIFQTPTNFASPIFALVILIPSIGGMLITMLTLLMRYLLIPFLLFLFPFAIFLYFTPFTQRWGRAFLAVIAAIVLMTSLDGLILLGLSSLFNSPDPNLLDPLAHAFAVFAGFAVMGIANLAIFVLALLSIVFQNNSVKTAVGLAVAGKALARAR